MLSLIVYQEMEAQGGRRSARAWVWVSIFVIGVAMGREIPLVEELLETGTSLTGDRASAISLA